MEEVSISVALEFQLKRETTDLYKFFLETLEDLQAQHETSISNLRKALQGTQRRVLKKHDLELFLEPIAAQANYFDQKLYSQLRKRVLDKGNKCIKNQEQELQKFEIEKLRKKEKGK